jgi:aryl-alcohol dehydrogenase-like predicted oxidoreductase
MTQYFQGKPAPSYVLGTMAMTGYYGPVDQTLVESTIARYIDMGGSFIDTADLYADGGNEALVGRCLSARRHDMVLATKFGYTFGERADQRGLDARPERVEAACDASLKRLNTDYIDIYYLHRVDPNVPIEDSYGAMTKLIEKGKVRALGLCEVGPNSYKKANAIHPVAVVQSEYSLWSREPEESMLQFLKENGTWFFGYASLGRGFLSGAIKSPDDFPLGDQRRDMPRFQGDNFRKNLELIEVLKQLAAEIGATSAQLALSWCRRNLDVSPIAGATTPAHIDDAQAAVALNVPKELWERLETVFLLGAAAGKRYSASAMKRLDSGL